MQAERVMWLAGIWLGLLWLNRQRGLFNVFKLRLRVDRHLNQSDAATVRLVCVSASRFYSP